MNRSKDNGKLRRRRNSNFDFAAKRRREIVLHARYVGAMDTEDRSRWLIAWLWHYQSRDPIWALIEAARTMWRPNRPINWEEQACIPTITEAEASAITEEASITRKHLTADNLARFLGVTYEQRQALGLTTIGSVNVKKRARQELRKLRACKALAAKRRANGIRVRAEYEANSIAAKARAEGVSRMTIYRRNRAAEQAKNQPNVTGVSTAFFVRSEDRPVTPASVEGLSERGFASKEARGLPSSQTATTLAADRYEALPIELRLLALGLVGGKKLARGYLTERNAA